MIWSSSKYFSAKEFVCPCCGRADVSEELVVALNVLRETVGVPVVVTSGYRCEGHNRAVGGAPNSFHTYGMAADIRPVGCSLDALVRAADPLFNGLKRYSTWVHVDVRPGIWRG
jgi:uncharacterized protein YcbK (DUF882 family)